MHVTCTLSKGYLCGTLDLGHATALALQNTELNDSRYQTGCFKNLPVLIFHQ